MIQFIGVTKQYPDNITALAEISLDIGDGEFVFLVGPSGSGKTTLIRLLIREELPSTGKIYFEDEDITGYNRSKVYTLRRKIGVIFQDFKLIPELTAYENVAFAMEAAGKAENEIRESVPYLLDIVGLSSRINSFPKQLSGGEKQKVAIARAMANNPKLLIADEPTGNLDPDSSWDIVQILSKINNWGTTVLMSTHGSDIVNSMHKRVVKLINGQVDRDDMKGSYEGVDDFTFKIMKQNGEENQAKLKQTVIGKQSSRPEKKINFRKKDAAGEAEKEDSRKNEISEEEISSAAEKIAVADLDLQDDTKKLLKKENYDNLKDLINAGVDTLQDLVSREKLLKPELKKISMIIKEFIANLEKKT